ncbi:helix-turn-helix transcriptional regulator [Leucobacter komagatae]|uniref:helix-turn-helix transcriptional regulator n=1 Tax=Leucobacter komagatae TaxID=55969 RepID=UPI0012EE01F1|nr:AlpA family phage regulatory protein [Leucobacter komagatae]
MGVEVEIQKLVRSEVARVLASMKDEAARVDRVAPCAACARDNDAHMTQALLPGYEPTWTTAQVAAFLGVKRQSVYNALSEGAVGFPRPRKNGRLNAFVPSEVEEYRRTLLGF